MTLKQRDALLEEMTEEIARLVLQDSYWQTCAITLDEAREVARAALKSDSPDAVQALVRERVPAANVG